MAQRKHSTEVRHKIFDSQHLLLTVALDSRSGGLTVAGALVRGSKPAAALSLAICKLDFLPGRLKL